MKVTVCFGGTRVVVPCGDGNLYVKDLIREAILRYKKATGKNSDAVVIVHHLQSMSGGGILDPDDRLNDVVDDREQIVVNFEDVANGVSQHAGGDGASGSSVGTCSPDIFRTMKKSQQMFHIDDESHIANHASNTNSNSNNIEVTVDDIQSVCNSSQLQVRRGSEPVLNIDTKSNQKMVQDEKSSDLNEQVLKRWSAAAPVLLESRTTNSLPSIHQRNYSYQLDANSTERDSNFSRNNNYRLSIQYSSPFLSENFSNLDWNENNMLKPPVLSNERKEPLGQAKCSDNININNNNSKVETIIISKEFGAKLGLHISPIADNNDNSNFDYCTSDGLLVEDIEPGELIDRDGRIAVHDRILEINGHNVAHVPYQKVHELFESSDQYPDHVVLKVLKDKQKAPPPPVYPKPINRRPTEIGTENYILNTNKLEEKENVDMIEVEEKQEKPTSKLAMVSPTKKLPQASNSNNSSIRSSQGASYALAVSNTRKIGKVIEIELVKGIHGLGFTITTRDTQTSENCPIYIKKILQRGAAVEDGRLRAGDRLLEANGIQMTGKTQNEAVAILRNAPLGSKVKIVVSRQIDDISDQEKEIENTTTTTTSIKESKLEEPSSQQVQSVNVESNTDNLCENQSDQLNVNLWGSRRVLTLNIPINDNEKSGLGISVKGKVFSDKEKTYDLGIFVKNVLEGGAAFRDKRIQINDQLLMVNGVRLFQQSNSQAMETLRHALINNKSNPNYVTISVARIRSDNDTNNESDYNVKNNTLFKVPQVPFHNPQQVPHQSIVITEPSQSTIPIHHNNNNNNIIENWNPVVNRLTLSDKSISQLRNDSYYIATRNAWNTSGQNMHDIQQNFDPKISTINTNNSKEKIIIEDEFVDGNINQQNFYLKDKGKPSFIGLEINEQQPSSAYESQSSLDTTIMQSIKFSRDGFGRQSVSEKRHATLDAKTMITYQQSKKIREERGTNVSSANNVNSKGLQRGGSMESIVDFKIKNNDIGEVVKKSSSLESVHNMFQKIKVNDDDTKIETNAKKHWLIDYPKEDDHRVNVFKVCNGQPKQNASADSSFQKKEKKKSSLLKNFSSMFRFAHTSNNSNTSNNNKSEISTANTSDYNHSQLKKSISYEHKPPLPPTAQQQVQMKQQDMQQKDNNNNSNMNMGMKAKIRTYSPNAQCVNYNEIQNQFIARKEQLTENQIAQMRIQVQKQRVKVEEENRKHYQSQRQSKSPNAHSRPVSNFYEYESIVGSLPPSNMMLQHNPTMMQRRFNDSPSYPTVSVSQTRRIFENQQQMQTQYKQNQNQNRYVPLNSSPGANDGPIINIHNPRRPYVTQVQIGGDHQNRHHQFSSKV